jgi:general secretion pathway protein J
MQKHLIKNSGFTLLEVLIALSIFAIIMVMVTTGLNAVLNFRDRIQVQQQRVHQLQLALFLLKRDIEQMVQYEGDPSSLISTDSEAIEFIRTGISNPEAQMPRSHLQKIRYVYSDDQLIRSFSDLRVLRDQKVEKSKKETIFSEQSKNFQEDLTEEPHWFSRTLLSDLKKVNFRFWVEKKWLKEWKEPFVSPSQRKYFLPQAILITIEMKSGKKISRIFRIASGEEYVAALKN